MHLFCYWSIHDDKVAHGGEGILIFTKIACVAIYGIGDPIFDKQARVLTLEFPQFFLVVSYNPQGGFKEDSLKFRGEWEKAFTKFLGNLDGKAREKGKGIIWAGDFNVNPLPGDWSDRAFDQIRHKISRENPPAGCREQDQESYRKMVSTISGTNVAEKFSAGPFKRTCFSNEQSLIKNFGQRIDHVVAQETFLDGKGALQISNFDVMQEFGGGRKLCSDH